MLLKEAKNPFWTDVIRAYTKWYTTAKKSLITSPHFEPLWGNPSIKMPFNSLLFKSNYLFLSDIIDELGTPISRNQMERITGKPIMFITYLAIWNSIPMPWKQVLRTTTRNENLTEPPIINFLRKGKKGTSHIRNIWNNQDSLSIPIGQQKWTTELHLTDNEDWKYLYKLAKQCKLNANTIFFQFQVLHRTIMTNKKMYQFNLRDDDLCDVCQIPETISHLLYDCPEIRFLWDHLLNWLSIVTNIDINFDKKAILLGDKNNDPIINTVIVITKHEIYKRKWKSNFLNLKLLKHAFKRQMESDIYIGTINNQLQKALGKWSSLHNALRLI